MSNAPPVAAWRCAAPPQERVDLRIDGGRAVGRFAIDARQLARFAEDGQQTLDAVRLVERRARRRDVAPVFFSQRDFDPAGHRRPVHAEQRAGGVRRPVEIEREEGASRDHTVGSSQASPSG